MPALYVIEHLDEAIEKKWCRVYYQPIVRTISGKLCAMELWRAGMTRIGAF